ncbi:unnamed protein product [Heligmosomoides polygyrus]|uniref:Transposase n=1 Tax=Heligmosomoides polygyrus TaxID=6339 RepID=A0A183GED1_HELPZ|nr:unnamed protein product [Heligmosomoides polygyrus]
MDYLPIRIADRRTGVQSDSRCRRIKAMNTDRLRQDPDHLQVLEKTSQERPRVKELITMRRCPQKGRALDPLREQGRALVPLREQGRA